MADTTSARPSGAIADAILQLHQPTRRRVNGMGCPHGFLYCSAGCWRTTGTPWPCATVRALYDACDLPHPAPVAAPRDHAKFIPLGECRSPEEIGKPCRWDRDHQEANRG